MTEPMPDSGERLDQKVVEFMPGLSRSAAAKLIEQEKVLVNGKPSKPSHKLKPADKVKINFNLEDFKHPKIQLPVIYEDENCVVINKPAGVLTHSKGAFNPEATVATWLADKVKNLEGERSGIVHRLDRATSGLMICAKTPEALSFLQKQFSQRKVKKIYIAVASGLFKNKEALIDMPIERSPKAPATFRVGPNGKTATTVYKVLEESECFSLVELKPETGRTHQLRVHLSKIGHPILGDTIYGGEPADRMFLHALKLEITLPSRERKVFEAPLPSEFNKVMKEK